VNKEGILWESTKIDFGLQNNLSPAYDMIGVFVDIAPIAIFDLALTAQAVGYYNFLGFGFYTLPSGTGPGLGYDADFNDSALSALTSKNTIGFSLSATPTFKIAFGPFAIADSFSFIFFSVDDGNGFFYEVVNNTVLAKNDYELINNAYLLYTVVPGVLVGLNDYVLCVPASGYVSHRLVAMGIYTMTFSPRLSFNAVLQLGTFLADKYMLYWFYVGGQVGITLAL
jgi:hypothetical protein